MKICEHCGALNTTSEPISYRGVATVWDCRSCHQPLDGRGTVAPTGAELRGIEGVRDTGNFVTPKRRVE